MTPRLIAVATGLPPTRFRQDEIRQHFVELHPGVRHRERAIRAIFERSGVAYRHSVVDAGYFGEERSTQARNEVYMREAVPLGVRTIAAGLAGAGVEAAAVDHLVVVSCTGLEIPGLDLHLAQQLHMRADLRRTCVLGMGCYGAFPGLKCAADSVRGRPEGLALMLSVELCSLHMQADDTAETVVSCALFSDGAGMALISGGAGEGAEIIGAATSCDYTTLEHMSFSLTDHGFRMYLSSYVPELLSAQVAAFVERLLGAHGLTVADVRLWGIHPGSTKIVDYVQAELHLRDAQVEVSHGILHDYGNMSSATILFVLERMIEAQQPQPGEYGVLLAFGPGLTMEGMLLRW